jgi:hypothetical protein
MKTRHILLSFGCLAFVGQALASQPSPVEVTLSRAPVWNIEGPVHVTIRPIKDGFVHPFYKKDGKPRLAVIDLRAHHTNVIEIKPLPEMQGLALRHADQRKDGTFIVSAGWVEKNFSRNGLIYVDATGAIQKKSGYGYSVGRIAILESGWVAATLQAPRNPDAHDPNEKSPFLAGYFHEDSGEFAQTDTLGANLKYSSYDEQHRDLLGRTVSPLPNGYVLCQAKGAIAIREELPQHSASTKGAHAFSTGGRNSTFEKPRPGAYEIIAIAPVQLGEGAPKYLLGWGRKRAVPLAKALRPDEKYDEMLLALYEEGLSQKPIAVMDVQEELWDVISDGRRVFAVLGHAFGAHIDEITIKSP